MDNEELDKLEYVITTEDISHYDVLYKLIFIGDTGVGKSCLRLRATQDDFKEEHDVTVGVEFGSYGIKIEEQVIKIQIWDTAGQETFKSVTKIFFKGAHCIFLVYDITKEDSFNSLKSWLREIRENAAENVLIMLVGNMLDLEHDRIITHEQALELKSQENLDGYIETSAKSGSNVKDLFVRAAKLMYLRNSKGYKPKSAEENVSFKLDKPTPEVHRKKSCC
eukprot:TRINITY_DN5114_c0_g2_i3.p1 TRINITY_DN5114_c0_g2~~TRINITY_DN5114_c0_g2_i3.p1  ORF type:complete len:222 (+),score=58.85 TRINITY_DN5114_c0_g2_i3:65-730(+)